MATVGIHAPEVNFETSTTTRTRAVAVAPSPLMEALRLQPGSRVRRWWTTVPACDNVNAVNRPTANSGTNASTLPPNPTISTPAATDKAIIPLENTRRSPRRASWWGRNPSRAMIDDSLGKSAKLVFADRHKIAAVAAWRTPYRGLLRPPNTAAPIVERIVCSVDRVGFRCTASTATPKKIPPRRIPVHISVVAALRDSGGRKFGTPLEIASTPERATAPDENAFKKANSVTPPSTV